MHVNLLLLSCLHAWPCKVIVTLAWTVAGQTIVLAIFIFHARVKDERKYRRCLTHHCAVVRCRSVHSNFTIAGRFKF